MAGFCYETSEAFANTINLNKTRLQRLLSFKFIPTTGKVNIIKVALKKSIHSEQGPHERTFP